MKAVILAGGKGTRLKPYTTVIPKPLVPIGEKPILEILIRRLIKCGVNELFICLNHFGEIIQAYFGDGNKIGIKINYSKEDKPLGTVAPIKLIPELPENFLVMNGDLLTNLDFRNLFEYHINNQNLLTVSTYRVKTKIDFGVIELDPTEKQIAGFKEKPEYFFDVSMGVYVMNRKLLNLIPSDTPFGFDNLMLTMLKDNKKISAYQYSGYWLDIGRPEDYEKANIDIPLINSW
jgi:NDP-sugar pyrophosphorylase family protein